MKQASNIHLPPGAATSINGGGGHQGQAKMAEGAFEQMAEFTLPDPPKGDLAPGACQALYTIQWTLHLFGDLSQLGRGGAARANLPTQGIIEWTATAPISEIEKRGDEFLNGAPLMFRATADLTEDQIEPIVHAGPAAGPLVALAIHKTHYRSAAGVGGKERKGLGFRFLGLVGEEVDSGAAKG